MLWDFLSSVLKWSDDENALDMLQSALSDSRVPKTLHVLIQARGPELRLVPHRRRSQSLMKKLSSARLRFSPNLKLIENKEDIENSINSVTRGIATLTSWSNEPQGNVTSVTRNPLFHVLFPSVTEDNIEEVLDMERLLQIGIQSELDRTTFRPERFHFATKAQIESCLESLHSVMADLKEKEKQIAAAASKTPPAQPQPTVGTNGNKQSHPENMKQATKRVQAISYEKSSNEKANAVDFSLRRTSPSLSPSLPMNTTPPAAPTPTYFSSGLMEAMELAHFGNKGTPAATPSEADGKTFSLAELKSPGPYPAGVDVSNRENYLSPADFKEALGIAVSEFKALPKWKQTILKKECGLY
jgi:hypothetical protein